MTICKYTAYNNFLSRFEGAFKFSSDGNLICNRERCTAVEELVNDPEIRFIVELVTGVVIQPLQFHETDKRLNMTKMTQYYGLLYTFYVRLSAMRT
jgi:hypothetical protein